LVSRIGPAQPFRTMPLVYERAFGGVDATHRDPARHAWERRNPVGRGFRTHATIDGLPLPNVEDPDDLIRSPSDRPAPQGFGLIGRDWEPRRSHAGTYDERWRREQAPLPPEDFDNHHFQAAHPDLVAVPRLRGDERVRVNGATPDGLLEFSLPGITIGVAVHPRRGSPERRVAHLDTVLLRPDERKLNMVWRSAIRCPRKVFDIERVVAFAVALKTALSIVPGAYRGEPQPHEHARP
jgi:hypothetical protein